MKRLEPWQRERFDQYLESTIEGLPKVYVGLLEELPLIVDDEPGADLLRDLGLEADDELFGLHTGVALTERSVEDSMEGPDHIMLFRGPLWRLANGDEAELQRQIRITLLHEIGHHFGLEEEDLDELGYG